MAEVIKLVTGEAALNSNATLQTFAAAGASGNTHNVLRIYNGNNATQVVTVNGSVSAANLTIAPANILILEKLWSDTVTASNAGLLVSVIAFTH